MEGSSLRPYLSIIIPIYNTEKYLRKCIDSILNQTYRDYELILVDDGSTDSSLSICDYYAEQDKRIKVIHKGNGGVTSARKAGLAVSYGEYISFVDSDDWMEADFYSILLSRVQETQAEILVASGYQKEEVIGHKVQNQEIHMKLRHGVYRQREVKKLLEKDRIAPPLWRKVYKRELISKNIWLIDNHVCIGEDKLCSYACMLDAGSVVIQKNCAYHYVQREDSAMHKYSEKKIRNVYYFARNLKKIRNCKNASFLDMQWNQVILRQLLNTIMQEFEKHGFFLSRGEIKELERKFKGIELSKLLIEEGHATVVRSRKKDENLILALYSLKYYRLLNFYIKIFKGLNNSGNRK